MKTHTLIALFSMSAGLVLAARPVLAETLSDTRYVKTVESYADTAAKQLRELRARVDAATGKASETNRRRYDETYDHLEHCDELLGQLRISDALDFEARKKEFEAERVRLNQVMQVAEER